MFSAQAKCLRVSAVATMETHSISARVENIVQQSIRQKHNCTLTPIDVQFAQSQGQPLSEPDPGHTSQSALGGA